MILLQILGVINIILLNILCVRCQDYEPEFVSILVDGPTIEIISGKSSIFKNEETKLASCEIFCAMFDYFDECIPQCVGNINKAHSMNMKAKVTFLSPSKYSHLMFNDSTFSTNDMSNNQLMTVKVGKGTYGPRPTVIWHDDIFQNLDSQLSIGRYCSLAPRITLLLDCDRYSTKVSNYHNSNKLSYIETKQFSNLNFTCSARPGGIHIGNDVWIGFDVVILPGVTVGDGAIIGARSVVRDDVEPYSIVIGNPARHYKYRFRPEEIEELLRVKWWEWSDEEIDDNLDAFLHDNDVHAFLIRAKQVMHNRNRTDLMLGLSELVSE